MPGANPSTLGPYLLETRIGTGGMAEIYLARGRGAAERERPCVVKRLLPELAGDADRVTLFLDEARINLLLDHRNIVPAFDVGRDGRDVYMALDHVDGVDLRWLLMAARRAGERIPPAIALYVTAELLAALDHAHNARTVDGRPLQLVHRDISPENVLLGHDGSVRLTDFGAARAVVSRSRLEPGTTLGKLGYLAPELLQRRPATAASDLFAVGLLLFEMLAARTLQREESAQGAYDFWQRFDATREIPNRVPMGEGGALLVKALERDPARRYRSARSFLGEVDELRLRRGERSAAADLAGLLERLRGVDGAGEVVTTSPVDLRSTGSRWSPQRGEWIVLAGGQRWVLGSGDEEKARSAAAAAPGSLVARTGGSWRVAWEIWPEQRVTGLGVVAWSPRRALVELEGLATRRGGWRVRLWIEGTAVDLELADGRVVGGQHRTTDDSAFGEPGAGPRIGAANSAELLEPVHRSLLGRREFGRLLVLALDEESTWAMILPAPELAGSAEDGAPTLRDVLRSAARFRP